MKCLSEIGVLIRVTPEDDIWLASSPEHTEYIEDRCPFVMQVEGLLEDGQITYGLYGKVTEGSARYQGLVCSLMIRLDGDDWRVRTRSQANFKVGPSPVYRDHALDFRHPQGTKIDGYPVIGMYGRIEVN